MGRWLDSTARLALAPIVTPMRVAVSVMGIGLQHKTVPRSSSQAQKSGQPHREWFRLNIATAIITPWASCGIGCNVVARRLPWMGSSLAQKNLRK